MQDKGIVIIQKDKILNSILELFIEDLGYSVIQIFSSFNDSIDFIKSNNIHTLIIDINSFDNKISVNDEIQIIKSLDLPIIIIGNKSDTEIAEQLTSHNIYSFMSKPIDKNILKINLDISFVQHQERRDTKNNTKNNEIISDCILNRYGIITAFSSSFLSILNLQTLNLNETNIKDILTEAFELIDFDRSIKKLEKIKILTTTFKYQDKIFQTKLEKDSSISYKLSINKSNLSSEFLYEQEILSQKYNGVFNGSSDAILVFNNNDELIEFNDLAKERYLGIFNKELYLGHKITDILTFIPSKELKNILTNIKVPSTHKLEKTIINGENSKTLLFKFSPLFSQTTKDSISGYIVSSQNISALTNALKQLHTIKEELRPLYESSIQRFYLVDENHKIISFNEAAQKTIQKEHNYTLSVGDSILPFIPKAVDTTAYIGSFTKVLKGEHIKFNHKYIINSKEYWNEVHYEPVISKNGDINRVLIWTLDITDSKRNLIALQESNKRNELIAKNGTDGVIDWDIVKNTVFFSANGKRLLGYNDSEIENKVGLRELLIHPDDIEENRIKLKDFLSSDKKFFENEVRMICKDQTSKWLKETSFAIRNSKGEAIRVIGSLSDISKKKESEAKLISLNNALIEERTILSKGNISVIRIDALDVKNIIYISENTLKLIGYTPSDFYNKKIPFKDLVHPDDRERHTNERANALEKGMSYINYDDYRLIKKDGTIIWIKDYTNIIKDENDIPVSLLGYIIDITDKKNTEKELEESQNMFSALWQNINFETFVVKKDGQIVFSRNPSIYSISNILSNKYYIYKKYKSLSDWNEIVYTLFEKLESHISIKGKNKITVSRIDNEKILVSTNIIFANLDE